MKWLRAAEIALPTAIKLVQLRWHKERLPVRGETRWHHNWHTIIILMRTSYLNWRIPKVPAKGKALVSADSRLLLRNVNGLRCSSACKCDELCDIVLEGKGNEQMLSLVAMLWYIILWRTIWNGWLPWWFDLEQSSVDSVQVFTQNVQEQRKTIHVHVITHASKWLERGKDVKETRQYVYIQ